jgi:transcription antitermination factor NusB
MSFHSNAHTGFDFYQNAEALSKQERRGLILCLLYMFEAHDYEISFQDLRYSYNIDFGIIIDLSDDLVGIVESIVERRCELDEKIKQYLKKWELDRLSTLVKLILRFGIYELEEELLDRAIIVNEAVELAKGYAEVDGYRIVNGILDSYKIDKDQNQEDFYLEI